MEQQFIASIIIFVIAYGIIISEKMNRTSIAMLGACVFLVFGILTQEEAIEHIDFNTIGLLVGMMIIVTIMSKTGFFQYVAIKAAKKVNGDPWKIVVIFCILSAVFSALLDNVTTVLLIVPITLVIVDTLELDPLPFVVPLVLAANIGGTATLIGDPPNIMIGSATGLGFMDFVVNLLPVAVVIFGVFLLMMKFKYKTKLVASEEKRAKIMVLDESLAIKDPVLLKKSLAVLGCTILGFMLHQGLGLESATVAIAGAAVLLTISKLEPEEILLEIEWTTIFFFMGLFVLVGGLEVTGVIEALAGGILSVVGDSTFVAAIVILWGCAIASAFLDNIPFVATMIPMIHQMGEMSTLDVGPLWWALALGACLGGNGTLVGASANVIVTGMLEKNNTPVSFIGFMKVGFPVMIVSIMISTVYLVIFYV